MTPYMADSFSVQTLLIVSGLLIIKQLFNRLEENSYNAPIVRQRIDELTTSNSAGSSGLIMLFED